MFYTFIKYAVLQLCFFYTYQKLLAIKQEKNSTTSPIITAVITALIISLIRDSFTAFVIPFMVIVITTVATFSNKITVILSLKTSILALGICYFLFLLSLFISAIVIPLLMPDNVPQPLYDSVLFTTTGILQVLLTIRLFKFRRFRNGMPFMLTNKSAASGVLLSLIILGIIYAYYTYQHTGTVFVIALATVMLAGFLILFWWQMKLTNSYIMKTKNREIEELTYELKKLQAENAELSKIIHKDNKLIPAMLMSVEKTLEMHNSSESNALIVELEKLSAERQGIIHHFTQTNKLWPSTGNLRIDSLISYMYAKAVSYGVNFDFRCNASLNHSHFPVDESIMATLIADLTENAIIASKDCSSKNVLLHLRIVENVWEIAVYDSGDTFSTDVLRSFGLRRTTTHASDGGSGIGLMTVYETLKLTHASFKITSLHNNPLYTKKVAVSFDGKFNMELSA